MVLAREVGLAPATETWRALVDQLTAMIDDDVFSSMGKESDHGTPGTGIKDRGDQDGDGFRNG